LKKRICIITSSYPSNKQDSKNAGVFVRDFARLLSKHYQVSVLAPYVKNAKNTEPEIDVYYLPWLSSELGLSSHNPKNPLHFFKLLSLIISGIFFTLKFVKKNHVDHCLAMWAIPSGVFALTAKILLQTPFFVWSLGSDVWKINEYPFGKFFLKKVLKNSKKNFADGLKLCKDVEKISGRKCEFLASARKLDILNNEYDYDKFNPLKKNFMFLGRYHPNKGIDLLIEAIQLLSNEEKEKSVFHIFGGGPLEKQIKGKVDDFDLSSFVFINDYLDSNQVFPCMKQANFIVIPSRIESIPVVLSDAINSSRPVIVTNVGDMGSLVSKYKVGWVADPNKHSLAKVLSNLIRMDERKMKIKTEDQNELKNYLDLNRSVSIFIKNIM